VKVTAKVIERKGKTLQEKEQRALARWHRSLISLFKGHLLIERKNLGGLGRMG
jgi:hypothetical protein